MAWIDGNGRVFGRVNLIDAALLVFVLGLIPIGVVTARVFRDRPPRIDAVVPASQTAGPRNRIRLKGADFRPYLRVFFNPAGEPFSLKDRIVEQTEGQFLIESPTEVEVQLPPLRPGSYDIHMMDETREILMRPSALTLEPPPLMTLRASVRFIALAEVAALLKPGDADIADAGANAAGQPARATLETVSASGAGLSVVDTLSMKGGRTLAVASPARAVDARVAIPAARNGLGIWMYRDQPIRPGDAFSFETATYSVRGVVSAVSTNERTAAAPPDSKGARP